MTTARKTTNQILEAIDDGILTNKYVLESLLKYLSEDQVAEFYKSFLEEENAEYLNAAAKQPAPRWYDPSGRIRTGTVI